MRQRRFVMRHGCQRVQRGRLSMQERRFQVRPGGDSTPGALRCTADLSLYPVRGRYRRCQAPARTANLLISATFGRVPGALRL